nr:ankyrin repeat domain-containing protein [Halochromatium salexigens]
MAKHARPRPCLATPAGLTIRRSSAPPRRPPPRAVPVFPVLVIVLASLGLLVGCDEPPQPSVNLYRAVHSGDLDQIKRHLFWQTDIDQPGPDGDYPLHVAVSQGRVAIARLLLEQGAQRDVRDAHGRTPLHVALANGKVQAAQLLLQEGADDDLQALLFALAEEQALDPDTIELLSARDVDLNATNSQGRTPLHLAVAADDVKLAKQLINAGAEVNRTDRHGMSALEIAHEQDQPTMITLLEQYGAERAR